MNSNLEHHLRHPVADSEAGVERFVFRHRAILILTFLLLTIYLAVQASRIEPDASFEKMIPTSHPYVESYLEHKQDLQGLGQALRVVVSAKQGDIFSPDFQETLRQVHEEVFYIPGVERSALRSIWSPAIRWNEVTEQGFTGGPVVGPSYDGSKEELENLRSNILKSGQVGALVANDFRSAMIYAPLMELNPETGDAIDYQELSNQLEERIRDKFQSENIGIHITGFAKVVGDLIDGIYLVAMFFGLALLITLVLLYAYSRCLRSSLSILLCSVVAVVWQLGLLKTLGYGLDPYSILIPFLVFAIGVSHGVQIVNAIAHEVFLGAGKERSARLAFRNLYVAGIIALVSDGVGFATLMVIDIAVIQDLAIAASIGVAVLILTNLVLLPVMMSYIGIGQAAIKRQQSNERPDHHPVWHFLASLTNPSRAKAVLATALILVAAGVYLSQDLKIGDLDAGAPELRPDSRYNRDNAFLTENYSTSTDIFVVMVQTAKDQCSDYQTLDVIDQLQWRLGQLPGVQSSRSLVNHTKQMMAGYNEGNIKWLALNRNQQLLDQASIKAAPGTINADCSLTPVFVYLDDHKAKTLESVVAEAEAFKSEFSEIEGIEIELAAGNAGIEAATNIVIAKAQYWMLAWVYGVVGILCLLTFRSLRTVLCILLPLALTSLLCQALMAKLGIGVKVATLPVIALGVGIGVDYGIYIYSKLEYFLKQGQSFHDAYFNTLRTTGKAVAFTGLTLGIGVGTWVMSPIKFQADMGLLLTFMFVWNMIGALILLPALATLLNKRPASREEPGEAEDGNGSAEPTSVGFDSRRSVLS
ncbi:MMPL family transporter [Marinobacter sp. tcs-11]|uniref:efflux RND transporter permease subunit n=1 Tax=Marinobacter sp. tcs-11 TaxID=1742860 RepID=UPI00257A8291|nr:MMPL family transporter [Marinobacter sp. tcs-11]